MGLLKTIGMALVGVTIYKMGKSCGIKEEKKRTETNKYLEELIKEHQPKTSVSEEEQKKRHDSLIKALKESLEKK